MMRLFLMLATAAIMGCGSGEDSGMMPGTGGTGPDGMGGTGGTGPDGMGMQVTGNCEEGGRASLDAYLPVAVGNRWQYEVIEAANQPPTTKGQEITMEFLPEGEPSPVLLQVTQKSTGRTENWLRREGDAVTRIRQMDYDMTGQLERTTVYVPGRERLDEDPSKLMDGNEWIEEYENVIYDAVGNEVRREMERDLWIVEDTDAACDVPWGQLECLHLRRIRLTGNSIKEYKFARGYGKVYEKGDTIEQLIGCELN